MKTTKSLNQEGLLTQVQTGMVCFPIDGKMASPTTFPAYSAVKGY